MSCNKGPHCVTGYRSTEPGQNRRAHHSRLTTASTTSSTTSKESEVGGDGVTLHRGCGHLWSHSATHNRNQRSPTPSPEPAINRGITKGRPHLHQSNSRDTTRSITSKKSEVGEGAALHRGCGDSRTHITTHDRNPRSPTSNPETATTDTHRGRPNLHQNKVRACRFDSIRAYPHHKSRDNIDPLHRHRSRSLRQKNLSNDPLLRTQTTRILPNIEHPHNQQCYTREKRRAGAKGGQSLQREGSVNTKQKQKTKGRSLEVSIWVAARRNRRVGSNEGEQKPKLEEA